MKQGAWDNYIANNTAMDPGNMWSMNLDIDTMGAPTTNNGGSIISPQQSQQDGAPVSNSQQQTPASVTTSNPGQVFMGATTPGTGNVM